MTYKTKINGKTVELSAGLFKTITEKLKKKSAFKSISANDTAFLEEELKFILNDMVLEAGIDLLFHAYIFRANKENGKITSVSLATKAGEMTVEADYFIDATGDAQLSFLAGCPTTVGRDGDSLCQPMTLCFRVGNVDVERFMKSKPALLKAHAAALENGELINPRENILVFKTPIHNVLHFNTTRVVKKNPTLPTEVTEAEILARRQVREIYEFMKKHADGLEDSFLMMTASEIGVRESRMIVGDYRLTESDCRTFKKFDDGIAACNYDIDIHNPEGSGTSHYYFPEGEFYTSPYRSLIPKGVENLLVAGRCISSDHGAQASYRIMATVSTIGEAAGCAIGIAVKDKVDVRGVNTEALKARLREHGAYIG